MANNKMQIYCKTCLGATAIAKYYPGEWMVHDEHLNDTLNTFFKEHKKCFIISGNRDQLTWGEDMFGFRTEGDDDGFITQFDPLRIVKRNI